MQEGRNISKPILSLAAAVLHLLRVLQTSKLPFLNVCSSYPDLRPLYCRATAGQIGWHIPMFSLLCVSTITPLNANHKRLILERAPSWIKLKIDYGKQELAKLMMKRYELRTQ